MNPPIIVTGPHRSGTTIASKIIASDFNLTPIDETEFQLGTDYTNCVIQLPNALDSHVLLKHAYPGVQFVFIIRSKADIIASMRRIRWCFDDVFDWEAFVSEFIDDRVLKWHMIKQDIPDQCAEVYYESLSDHPLFIQQDARQEFTSKQWEQDRPVGPRYWNNNQQAGIELYGTRHSSST